MTRFGPIMEPITFPTPSRYAMCYAENAGSITKVDILVMNEYIQVSLLIYDLSNNKILLTPIPTPINLL